MPADGFFIMTIKAWDNYFHNNLILTAVKFEISLQFHLTLIIAMSDIPLMNFIRI